MHADSPIIRNTGSTAFGGEVIRYLTESTVLCVRVNGFIPQFGEFEAQRESV